MMFHENRFFIKFLVQLAALVLIPVFLMTLYVQNIVYRRLTKSTEELNENYFQTIGSYIEDVLDNAFSAGIYLNTDQEVRKLFVMQKTGNTSSLEYLNTQYSIKQRLKVLQDTNSAIHSIYIYNGDSGNILLSDGTLTRIENHCDTGWLEYYDQCMKTYEARILPERVALDAEYWSFINNQAESVLSVAIPIRVRVGAACNGMVLINIRKEELFNATLADGFACLIYQGDKTILSSCLGQDMNEEILYQAMEYQKDSNHVARLQLSGDNERYNAYYKKLSKYDVVYSIIGSMNDMQSALRGIQLTILLIMVSSIVLCMLIAIRIARRYCTPIVTISRSLEKLVPMDKDEDQLHYIAEAVRNISSRYREISQADMDLFGELLPDTAADDPHRETVFFCAVVSIDNFTQVSKNKSAEEICQIKKQLIADAQHDLPKSTVCVGTLLNGDKTLLIYEAQLPLDEEDTQKLLRGVRLDCDDVTVSVGIGGQYECRSDLTQSYLEALDAVKYRLVLGHHCLALYDEVVFGRRDAVGPQPLKILELLAKANYEEVQQTLYSYFVKLKKTVAVDDNTLFEYVLPIASDLSHFLSNNGIPISSVLDHEQPIMLLLSRDTFDDIYQLLCEICRSVFELIAYQMDDETYMKQISDIVYQEYSNPQIDISAVAEKVGISYSYVCKIVKDKTKLSFTNYLNFHRIKVVKELLEQTDLSVQLIAEKVGYINSQSLTHYFKKFEGITPGKYRRLYRGPKTNLDQ